MKHMRLFLSGVLAAACLVGVSPAQQPVAAKKSALDKGVLEAYIRHLFVWSASQIQVKIDDPRPAPFAGFVEFKITAAAGPAVQEEIFYVSKDGRKIIRGAVYDVNQNPFKLELDKLKTESQPGLGTPGAGVVLVLFTDFQCPYCREEAKTLRQNLLKDYPSQVRLYFKDFPLSQIHNWAKLASIAGRCVFHQNGAAFWDYHDWVFEKQGELTPENLKAKVMEWAAGKNVDALQLGRCLDARSTEAEVDRNVAEGRALNVNATPTLFINGRRIAQQIPWPNLRQVIDFELEYQKTAKNAGEEACCEVKLPSPLSK